MKISEASLENILQFCTGLKRVPPTGLKDPITIKCLFTSPLPINCTHNNLVDVNTVEIVVIILFNVYKYIIYTAPRKRSRFSVVQNCFEIYFHSLMLLLP